MLYENPDPNHIPVDCFVLTETHYFLTNKTIAHRGICKTDTLLQNSIASLRKAITLKTTGSEFDVRMTKDEVLVINHNVA